MTETTSVKDAFGNIVKQLKDPRVRHMTFRAAVHYVYREIYTLLWVMLTFALLATTAPVINGDALAYLDSGTALIVTLVILMMLLICLGVLVLLRVPSHREIADRMWEREKQAMSDME